jgi:hypothetical protein
LERDQRRGTLLDIERIIAGGLTSIREDPEDQPQENRTDGQEELVDSRQDLIRTDNVNQAGERQSREQARLQIMSPAPSMIRIEFKIYERDVWRTDRSLLVDPSELSEVERVARKYIREKLRPFDTSFRLLVLGKYFQVVTADRTNTILVIPEDNIRVNNQLVVFEPASDTGPSTSGRGEKGSLITQPRYSLLRLR